MIPHLKVPICMFHKVEGKVVHSRSWVTPKIFRKQMETLVEYGYRAISFDGFLAGRNGVILPEKPIIITFDDGYQSVYTEAFPILREFNFTATLFLTTSLLSEKNRQSNSWDTTGEDRWLTYHLLWAEVTEMIGAGFSVGSHGLIHHPLDCLEAKSAEKQLVVSRSILQKRLNVPVTVFSYPFGSGSKDQKFKDLVRKAGYECAVASGGNPTEYLDTDDLFALKRKTMIELPFHWTGKQNCFLRYIDSSFNCKELLSG